jgi:hypothetical protein
MKKGLLLSILSIIILPLCVNALYAQIPSYIPTNGLVGWWPFNGNANDESGNGNNGTVNGATLTIDRYGVANKAYSFDGVNDYIQTSFLGISGNNSRTVSFWAKTTGTSNTLSDNMNVLCYGGIGNGANWEVALNHGCQGLTVDINQGVQTLSCNSNNDSWNHFLVVFDNTLGSNFNAVKFYFNGIQISNICQLGQLTTINSSSSNAAVIGAYWNHINRFFNGRLDDIGIWNRALTQSEITALYNSPVPPSPLTLAVSPASTTICDGSSTTLSATANAGSSVCASSQLPTGLQSGLVGYWPFCGNANDASGNGNNGVVNGTIDYVNDRFGNTSSSVYFNPSSAINTSIGQPANCTFSFSLWLKVPTNYNSGGAPIRMTETSSGPSALVDKMIQVLSPSNNVALYVYPGYQIYLTSPNSIADNQWHHIVASTSSSGMYLYVDGLLVATNPNTSCENFAGFWRMQLTEGFLDDLMIYNRALTTSEIQQLYTLGNASYSWSPGGATTSSITVSPTTTTTYTCTATANGVSSTSSSVVTVTPAPTITTTNTSVCAGQSTTLTASTTSSGSGSGSNCPTLSGFLATGLVGYWPFCGNANDASGNGNNGTVNGATLTTDRFGNASSAYSFDGVNDNIQVLNSPSLGSNITSQLTLSVWSKFNGFPFGFAPMVSKDGPVYHQYEIFTEPNILGFWSTNIYSSATVANPLNTWNHYITTFDNGTIKYYKNGILIFTEIVSQSTTQPSSNSNLEFGADTPNGAQYLHGILDDIAIWNRALTASEIQALYTTGQTTYAWSNGATTPSITVSPTTTTTYTCTVTDPSGTSCIATQTITVNPLPNVNAGADISVCSGSTATLTATGAASYSWTNNVQNGVSFTPTSTATYTVTGTSNGCTATDAVTVTVNPTPTITATNTTVCAGQSTTLTASTTSTGTGSNCPTLSGTLTNGLIESYSFCGNANNSINSANNGAEVGATLSVDAFGNSNSAYTFNGTSDYINIPNDFMNSQASSSTSFRIRFKKNANGSVGLWNKDGSWLETAIYVTNDNKFGIFWAYPSYYSAIETPVNTIQNNVWYDAVIIISNNTGQIYLNGTLQNNTSISISNSTIGFSSSGTCGAGVNRFGFQKVSCSPNYFFNGSIDEFQLYNRELTTSEIQALYTTGQTTYSWSNGATTPSITVSPATTTTYTCTVTDPSGTSCTATQTITVNPLPNVNAGVDQSVCSGSTATLTATGAASYAWTNNVQNGVAFTPIATNTYTVTGTDANGCTATDAVTLTVVPTPTITATNTNVCAGQSTTLTASTTSSGSGSNCPTLSGSLTSGLVGYWPFCGNANDGSGNGNNGTVNGATLTTDRFGNASSAYNFDGVSSYIDVAHSSTLNLSNAYSVEFWVNNFNNTGGWYSTVSKDNWFANQGFINYIAATVFSSVNCAASNHATTSLPINSWIHIAVTFENNTLKVYKNGLLVATENQTFTNATTSLRFGARHQNDGTGITNYFNGLLDDIAIWNRALTASEIQALYTTGQTTYSWSNGATTPSITVTPTTTTTYTCTVTDANGNSCSVDQTITVVPFNGVNAGTDQTICAGGSVSLTATGATTYSWNNNVQNGVAFSPLATSNYIVTGTQNGCTDADTVLLTVLADPTITNPVAASYCQNGGPVTPLTVSVSGGISSAYAYQWFSNTSVNNFGGTAILGATTATYTPPISTVGSTFYYCTVTQGGVNTGCATTSGANSIVVNAQPSIASQPLSNQSGCVGASLSALTVNITGGLGTPSYQWYVNTVSSTTSGTVIPGANTSSYSAPNANAGSNYYYCIATFANSSSCATQTSNIAGISLVNDPIFTTAPTANQSVCVGGSIPALTFSSTGGSGTASYQWYAVNGSTYTTILGATNPSYTPPIFNIAGNYAYAVAVTQAGNGCASGYSPLANVTVVNDPNVSSPTGSNYCQGGAVSNPFSVSATGGINSAYTYQWYSNGANNNTTGIAIPGATAANYTPPTGNIGTMYYYCQVSQGAGCLSSSPTANITVVAGPALSSQPLGSQSVCVGATLNAYSVSYTGGTGTPSYQWYSSASNSTINGTAIPGAVAAAYTPGANAVGQNYYYCVLTFNSLTGCSTLTSNAGQVNILANPTFSISPIASQTICQGANPQTLSFTTTGGSGTATYQWYNVVNSNYTPIIGANGLTYTPSASLPAGTYNYAVAMTQNASGCSTGFSSNSQLVVLPQPVVSTPQGGVYCQGGSISQPLSVSVTGGNGASNYQWYQSTTNNNSGGTAINGATNSSFTPSLANFGTLYYYCVVSQNAGCTATSAVATVVSNPSPVISTQPTANQTICVGSSPTPLTTSYTGGVGTPSYQWYVNSLNTTLGGSSIGGAISNTYIPSNQVGLGSNYYYCVVTLSNSSCPQATTNVATVNTVANPSLNGPTSATYCQSTGAAQPLSVSASGGNGTTYNYQWYNNVNNANFGGSPISGATNPSYTPTINGSSTYYYCVVTQPGGCLSASAVASVAIVPAPSITSQPLVGQTLCVGGTPQTLSIATTGGVANPSYQWYSNTVNTLTNAQAITNANSANFNPAAVSSTGTTYYFCEVNYAANSACPTLVSNAATIIVASDPIMSNPTSATYCQNAASVAPLTVNASGGINVVYAYQWYSNTNNSNIGGTAIVGATSNNYFPVVNQLGTTYYYCEVTQGSGCNASSATAAVVVGVAANITQQPTASQNICLGQSATTLTVGITAGNYALSYQWYSNVNNNNFGGTLIVGATNAFYTPPSTVLGTKYYYCVISVAGGGCGTLSSNTATINVLSAPSMFQPNNQTVCCQIGSAPITFVGNASNYNWTATGSSPLLTGYNTSGTGDIPTLTLNNNSTTPQNVVYLVTPSNQGCNGTPVQFSINVMPCLSVSTPSDQYYCAQNNVSSYVFSGVGSSFNWVNSNPAIGLQNAGVNFVPNFVAQNTTTTIQTATITVTPSFMGCAGTPQSYTITVYPLPIIDAGVDQAVCAGGSVTLSASGAPSLTWNNGITNGQTFIPNASTTYTVTGTDANGCQNQDAVFVQVNQPTSATLNITACDSYTLNGQTYTQSGTYDQLLSNSAGCDSSLTLNLSLNFSPSQPNVYVQNQVNLSTDLIPGLTYQWITCSDLTSIAGQTAITYNPNSNGVYAVVVTNSCGSDTSLCASITTIGLEENAFDQITLYPNPNNGNFTLEVSEALIGKKVHIYDMQGRLLDQLELSTKLNYIEFTHYARGAYWLQIDNEVPLKWIKN